MKMLALLLTLFPLGQAAEEVVTHADTVVAADGVEDIYRQFDDSFRNLDARPISNLYSDDALYLGPAGDIVRGRDSIAKEFARSFDDVRSRRGTMAIAFKVVDRRIAGNVVADTGYFTITRTFATETKNSRGKYVNVFEKDRAGNWRLRVDMYSPAP